MDAFIRYEIDEGTITTRCRTDWIARRIYMTNIAGKLIVALGVVAASFAGQGCATLEGEMATFSALGAATGAAIGHQQGRAGEGALLGALFGAAGAAITHDLQHRQRNIVPSPAMPSLPHAIPATPRIEFEHASVSPATVAPGGDVYGEIVYAVYGSQAGIEVREQFFLVKNGTIVRTLADGVVIRQDGAFVRGVSLGVRDGVTGPFEVVAVLTTPFERQAIQATFLVANGGNRGAPPPSQRGRHVYAHRP